jgi:hypothetical protein
VKAKTVAGIAHQAQNLVLNAEFPGGTIPPITITVHPDRAALPQ